MNYVKFNLLLRLDSQALIVFSLWWCTFIVDYIIWFCNSIVTCSVSSIKGDEYSLIFRFYFYIFK